MSSFQMAPLWQDFSYLQSWFEKIKGRDAYKKAIDNWGDITAEKRKVEGQAAFETVKLLWEEPSEWGALFIERVKHCQLNYTIFPNRLAV